jgi:EpsG family
VLPYWLIFTLFAAGTVQAARQDQQLRRSHILLGVIAIVPALIIGMRYQTGADWEPYLYIFEIIRYMPLSEAATFDDPGYSLLNWTVSNLGLNIWAVNLVCSALFFWGLITFAKHQPNPWLACLAAVPYLIVVVAVGYTRQAVAIGLIMAAIVAWERNQLVRFAICILVAATFHKTAVLALPLVALSSKRNRFLTGVLVLLLAAGLYSVFLAESVDMMVTNYVDAEYSSQGAAIRVAMNVVPAAVFLLYQRRFGLPDEQRRMWLNFSYATALTVVLLVVLPSSTVVDRIALYLIPLQLFVFARLPYVFSTQGKPNGQMILLVIAYAATILFVWLNYATHAEYWLPYASWPLEGAETTPNLEGL